MVIVITITRITKDIPVSTPIVTKTALTQTPIQIPIKNENNVLAIAFSLFVYIFNLFIY